MTRNTKAAPVKVPRIIQLPSGQYFCHIRSKGRSIPITLPTPEAVYAEAVRVKLELAQTEVLEDPGLTLRQACEKYIRSRTGRLDPSTIEGYENIVRNRFKDLMEQKVKRITRKMLEDALDAECSLITRRGTPIHPKTVRNAWHFICTVLGKYAPHIKTDGIDLPEVRRVPLVLPDPEAVIASVIGTPVELPCLLAAWYSFSMSEIRGLTKSKSLQGDQIVIVETVVRVKGVDCRKPGSKEAGRARAATLHPYIRALIDQVEGDIIVPATPNSIMKRFKTAQTAANLPPISFHKLRHLNISLMSMLQIPKAVSRLRGGYSNDSVMESVYDNAFSPSLKAAETAVDAYMLGVISKSKNANEPKNADK